MTAAQQRSRAEQTIVEYLRHYAGLWAWRESQSRYGSDDPSLTRQLRDAAARASMDTLEMAVEAGIPWAEARRIQDQAQDEFLRVHNEMGRPDYDKVDMDLLINGGHHWMYGVYWGRQLAEARLNVVGWTLRGTRYVDPEDV